MKDKNKKDILNKVIAQLEQGNNNCYSIKHKRFWLHFLKNGKLNFTPEKLHNVLMEIIKDNPPKGDKLFCMNTHYNFTVINKKAYRTEEALERFIIASNPDSEFFNQIPIGGKKESIDFGIKENESRFAFIELKQWSSNDSPLYAIVESLKNLIEYEIIKKRGISNYTQIDLIILAPEDYYINHKLIDKETGQPQQDKLKIVKTLLNELSSKFNTNISLTKLRLGKETFLNKCKNICDERNIGNDKQTLEILKEDKFAELERNKWDLLVSSDK
jgi:hypothetical protein